MKKVKGKLPKGKVNRRDRFIIHQIGNDEDADAQKWLENERIARRIDENEKRRQEHELFLSMKNLGIGKKYNYKDEPW